MPALFAMKSLLRFSLGCALAATVTLGVGWSAQDVSPPATAASGPAGKSPFGSHAATAAAEEVPELVSLLGTTQVDGRVRRDAVAIGGDTRVGPEGRVGGAAVAVFGRVHNEGSVAHDAVTVFGGATINGEVGGEVVSVFGDVDLGPRAVVNGDVVVVGGRLTREPGAVVRGHEVRISAFGPDGSAAGLAAWFSQCVLKARPLAFGADLGWVWAIAVGFLGFYLLLALLLPAPLERCVGTLEQRPGGSVLTALLTVVLSPFVIVLLTLTVVGVAVVPFLALGLCFAGLFGKAVLLAWVGRRILVACGRGTPPHPVFAVLVGGVLVMLLYTVWGSLLLHQLLSWLGLGVVVLTVVSALRRARRSAPSLLPEPADLGVGGAPGPGPVAPELPFLAAAPLTAPVPPVLPSGTPPRLEPDVTTLPRAGFFLRLAALAIDAIVIGMVAGLLSGALPSSLRFHHGPGGILLGLAVYGALLWKLRGTTIGGIVCHLRVVRLDRRELDWPTVVVRSLGCFLSLFVGGLGFLWVAFDEERQSWHDRIAGTTVVVLPRGQSLL
jgi:uncharacterized RDD family membrane protein YckC